MLKQIQRLNETQKRRNKSKKETEKTPFLRQKKNNTIKKRGHKASQVNIKISRKKCKKRNITESP